MNSNTAADVMHEVRQFDRTRAPLTWMQDRIVSHEPAGRTAFHVGAACWLRGELDELALDRSIAALVSGHPALRTLLSAHDGTVWRRLMPGVESVSVFPAERLEPVEQSVDACVAKRLRELSLVPFDLEQGPLFRARVLAVSRHEHVLLLLAHQVVADRASMAVLMRDLGRLYGEHVRHEAPRAAEWLSGELAWADLPHERIEGAVDRDRLQHWRTRLAELPGPLELHTDHPRTANSSRRAETVWLDVPIEVSDRMRREVEVDTDSRSMAALAAYVVFLNRHTAQSDMAVALAARSRGRNRRDGVGCFTMMLPLRVGVEAMDSYRDVLRRVRADVLEACESPDIPLDRLASELAFAEDGALGMTCRAFFGYEALHPFESGWEGLKTEPIPIAASGIAEDLGIWLSEHPSGLRLSIDFNVDLFDRATVEMLARRYVQLLDAATSDPDRAVADLPIALESEYVAFRDWNGRVAAIDRDHTLHGLVHAQVLRTPEAVAVIVGTELLSYRQLDMRANRLSHVLRSRGVGRGAAVGLYLERSVEMVVAQLAVLKAGGAYVPLDPAYPRERLAYMAQDSNLTLLVSESTLDGIDWPGDSTLLLDVDALAIAAQPGEMLPVDDRSARPEDTAYVMYTSGSTGRPKGVVVSHRPVVNFLVAMASEPGMVAEDILVAVTPLSFDPSVLDLLLPLMVGARVVLASRSQATDGHALRELLESSGATVLQATPSTWRLLIQAGWQGSDEFKALIGGEALTLDLAEQLLARTGELWNLYGPTETTVWATCWKVVHPARGISIGKPIPNVAVWIRDDGGRLCPIGVPGEICIAGAGMTAGYQNRPELNAAQFVRNDLDASPAALLYRTGDRGRWRHDGLLEHVGRLDFQVKIRGHRVEMGEVEAALLACGSVAQAVVVARDVQSGEKALAAYVVPANAVSFPVADLRAHLRERLPEYMVPQYLVALPALPLTPNGKVDRKALPAPAESRPHLSTTYACASSAHQTVLTSIWESVLGVQPVGIDDNFFDLGGSSLLVVQMLAEVEQRTGRRIGLGQVFAKPTIRALESHLDDQASAGSPQAMPHAGDIGGMRGLLDPAHPPVAGARLGRDPDGGPAWFVPRPGHPGKYVKYE